MYLGASLVSGFGMSFRHNFIHHSLEVPGLHGRGGIYFDDHESGISNASGNVLYKAAGRAFLVNGGGNNNITNNLIVNGGIGIYNQHYDDYVKPLPLYDNGTLKRGDKGDFIWRTEKSLQVESYDDLFLTPFATRFRTFATMLKVNSTVKGWASAAGSNFNNNVFLNNSVGNVCFTVNSGPNGSACDADLNKTGSSAFLNLAGNVEGTWEQFPGAGQLEFVNSGYGFDTREAGLRCDEFRTKLPTPSVYRPWVKEAFAGVPSTAPKGSKYTPEAAEIRGGLRSGQRLVLTDTVACPPLQKQDCSGSWLAWGECERGVVVGSRATGIPASGVQIMRWTVEQPALNGGACCIVADGTAKQFAC